VPKGVEYEYVDGVESKRGEITYPVALSQITTLICPFLPIETSFF